MRHAAPEGLLPLVLLGCEADPTATSGADGLPWAGRPVALLLAGLGLAIACWLMQLHRALARRPGAAASPDDGLSPRARAALVLGMLLAAAAFGCLTLDVLAGRGLARSDAALTSALAAVRRPWLTAAMLAVTWLGSFVGLAAGSLAVGLWRLARRGDRGPLALLGATLLGAVALNGALKALVARARPPAELHLTWALGAAFPSGHATSAAATLGMLAALLAAGRGPASRAALGALAVVLALAVGFSRVYLGVHWFSDVLGGWLLGLLWLLALRLGLPAGAARR